MRMYKSKKSSLSISINAIVVIVLAMTFLGLGLGFVRNMFSGLSETTGSVQEQIKQQILDDLRTGNKKLSFPTNEIKMGYKESKVLAVGVKNTGSEPLTFTLQITPSTGDFGTFIWDTSTQTLAVNEAQVYPLKLTAGTVPNTYIIKIVAMSGTAEYASKSFFITVQ